MTGLPNFLIGSAMFRKLIVIVLLAAWCLPVESAFAADDNAAREIRFDQFYSGSGSQGPEFSPLARALAGKRVRITAYAAAPFRAEAEFMMLTRSSMHVCPNCNSDNNWPVDIIVAYTKGVIAAPNPTTQISVTGTLELGAKLDPVTGMVSQLRLVDSVVEPTRR
jgi:hypothetical protein